MTNYNFDEMTREELIEEIEELNVVIENMSDDMDRKQEELNIMKVDNY